MKSKPEIAHFKKEWKPGVGLYARSIMGSFAGAHAHLFLTLAPETSHNSARAYTRPRFPLFLKVGYTFDTRVESILSS